MNILVPFLATPAGFAAASRAGEEITLRGGGGLRLVAHVRVVDADAGAEVRQMRAALEEAVQRLEADGVDAEGVWSLGAQTLSARALEVAEDWPAELIVMGLRRRSRVGKLILGSHEQSILLGATCPVLTVQAGS